MTPTRRATKEIDPSQNSHCRDRPQTADNRHTAATLVARGAQAQVQPCDMLSVASHCSQPSAARHGMLPGHKHACMQVLPTQFPPSMGCSPHKQTGRSRTLVTGIRKLVAHVITQGIITQGTSRQGQDTLSAADPSAAKEAGHTLTQLQSHSKACPGPTPRRGWGCPAPRLLFSPKLQSCVLPHTCTTWLRASAVTQHHPSCVPRQSYGLGAAVALAPTLLSQVNVSQASRHTPPTRHAKVVLLGFQAVPSSDRPDGPPDCNRVPQRHSKHTGGLNTVKRWPPLQRALQQPPAGYPPTCTHTAQLQQSGCKLTVTGAPSSCSHRDTHTPLGRITHPGMLIPRYLNAVWRS